MDNMEHLSDARLASFIDNKLDDTLREEVMKHLLVCSVCRMVMMESHMAKKSYIDRKKHLVLRVVVPFALAASLLMVVVPLSKDNINSSSLTKKLPQKDESWLVQAKEWLSQQIKKVLNKD